VLCNPEKEIYLSTASLWEAILLLEKKADHIEGRLRRLVQEIEARTGIDRSAVELGNCARDTIYKLGYRDPRDRFLVATAKVLDLTLVTADEPLMQIPGLNVLANG